VFDEEGEKGERVLGGYDIEDIFIKPYL